MMLDFGMDFIAPKPIIQCPRNDGFRSITACDGFRRVMVHTNIQIHVAPLPILQSIQKSIIPIPNLEYGGHRTNFADINRKSHIGGMMNTTNRQYFLHIHV